MNLKLKVIAVLTLISTEHLLLSKAFSVAKETTEYSKYELQTYRNIKYLGLMQISIGTDPRVSTVSPLDTPHW